MLNINWSSHSTHNSKDFGIGWALDTSELIRFWNELLKQQRRAAIHQKSHGQNHVKQLDDYKTDAFIEENVKMKITKKGA